MPFRKKHMPSPSAAIRIPASDGPNRRALFTMEEFKAIAFDRSSFSSTISIMKAWRTGVSQALMTPRNMLKINICQIATAPVKTSIESTSA